MKNWNSGRWVIMMQLFSVFFAAAMDDRPALLWYEKAGMWGAKAAGAVAGTKVGSYIGESYDRKLAGEDDEHLGDLEQEELEDEEEDEDLSDDEDGGSAAVRVAKVPVKKKVVKEVEQKAQTEQEWKAEQNKLEEEAIAGIKKTVRGIAVDIFQPGKRTGWVVGGVAGYHAGGHLAKRALAWRHGVSYRVERVSHFYNINIKQYGPLLVAADKKDIEGIKKEMEALFSARFGKNWEQKVRSCFKYENYPFYLETKKRATLDEQEKEDMRILELGAALEDLFVNRSPSKKRIVKSALAMYEFLGFVRSPGTRLSN